jgi:hypothetical protein
MNGMSERGHLNEPPNKKHLHILALNVGSVTGCAYSYPDVYTLFIAHPCGARVCLIWNLNYLGYTGTRLHRAGVEPVLSKLHLNKKDSPSESLFVCSRSSFRKILRPKQRMKI